MAYVDGFLLPIPRKNLPKYKRMAAKFRDFCKEMGALDYSECVADDVKPGKVTSFPRAVKLKRGEVVVFSWVVYATKGARDRANRKMMKDPRFAEFMDPKKLPFDGMRMIYGGFKPFLTL